MFISFKAKRQDFNELNICRLHLYTLETGKKELLWDIITPIMKTNIFHPGKAQHSQITWQKSYRNGEKQTQTAESDPRPFFTIKMWVSAFEPTRLLFDWCHEPPPERWNKNLWIERVEGRSFNACEQNGLRVWTTHRQVTQQERFSTSGKTPLSQEWNPKITRGSMKFASLNTIMCQTGFIGIFYASVRRK